MILLNGSPKLDRFQYMALSIFGRMTFYLKSVSFKVYLPHSSDIHIQYTQTTYRIDAVAKFSILQHPMLGSNGHIWSHNEHREIGLDTLYINNINYHKMFGWKPYVFVTMTCTHKNTLRPNLKRYMVWYKSEHATRSHNLRICFVSGHHYIYI